MDRVLGFGGSSSPAIFGAIAQAIHYIAVQETQRKFPMCDFEILHLADDFLVVGSTPVHTAMAFASINHVLKEMGIPTEPSKNQLPCHELTYLGLVLNAKNGTIAIPDDKRNGMVADIEALVALKMFGVKKAQSIVGKLHFTHMCFACLFPLVADFYPLLKPAVRSGITSFPPTKEIKENLHTLRAAILLNPIGKFDDFDIPIAESDVTFAIDASGRDGVGGFAITRDGNGSSFHMPWPKAKWDMDEEETSSGLQEMAAICVALSLVPSQSTVSIFSDSSNATNAMAKGFSTKKRINFVLRRIMFVCFSREINLKVIWHSRDGSPSALAADKLSHGCIVDAQALVPTDITKDFQTLSPQDFLNSLETSINTSSLQSHFQP